MYVMNAQYINPFIHAFMRIYKQMYTTDINIQRGDIYIKYGEQKLKNSVAVRVDIDGYKNNDKKDSIQGYMVLEMHRMYAQVIAARMMHTDRTTFDELCKSAVSELCNMIVGDACCYLSDKMNHIVNIQCPRVFEEQINYRNNTVAIPIQFEGVTIEMDIYMA